MGFSFSLNLYEIYQVWDLAGRKIFNFEGHEAPVYSICPHHKENIQVRQII